MRAHEHTKKNTPFLRSSLPSPSNLELRSPTYYPSISTQVFGKTLEWNLRFVLLNSMFDSDFALRDGFDSPANVSSKIKRKMKREEERRREKEKERKRLIENERRHTSCRMGLCVYCQIPKYVPEGFFS
jgi:hypothetical protein